MSQEIRHFQNWAKSAKGQPLSLILSPHFNPSLPCLLFIGGVHGDEPEGVELAKKTHLWLENLTHDEQLQLTPWALIPCLNPDGYQTDQRTNGNGVDLNRNFPSSDWSPKHSTERYFPGNSPASEPEVKALTQWIKNHHVELIVHCHSWEPSITYTGPPARKIATAMAQSIHYRAQDDIGYPTPGSLGQYAWNDLKIPVICIEVEEKIPLKSVWPLFHPAIKTLFMRESS